jgi:hypothetical protein
MHELDAQDHAADAETEQDQCAERRGDLKKKSFHGHNLR